MVCKNCGANNKMSSNFCDKCGERITKSRMWVLICAPMVVAFITLLYFAMIGRGISEDIVKSAIKENDLLVFSEDTTGVYKDEKIVFNNIDSLTIVEQDAFNDTTIASCIVEMSNDSRSVIANYNFRLLRVKGNKWKLRDYEVISYKFYPKKQVDENIACSDLEKDVLSEMDFSTDYFVGEKYSYKPIVKLNIAEHNPSLLEGKDTLSFHASVGNDYYIASGTIKVFYSFNDATGLWEYEGKDDSDMDYSYQPTGQWRFDIATHYYRMEITNINYKDNKITLFYNDDVYQSVSDHRDLTKKAVVDFTMDGYGMYLSPIHVTKEYIGYSREEDIYIQFRRDTMYISTDGEHYQMTHWGRNIP